MLHSVCFYYFSPTGGTKKAGEMVCAKLAEQVTAVDLGSREWKPEEPQCQLAVFAAPVFGGRIPNVVTEKLQKLEGQGVQAVTLAVYGNRAYEDALLELNRTVQERGFRVTASAALVARHSIVPEVGQGRPDDQDEKEIGEFAEKLLDKLAKQEDTPVEVPGNYPYKPGMNMAVSPISLPDCRQCGKCAAVCPTGAIAINNKEVITDAETCILCMACTSVCPEHARILPPPLQESMEQKLGVLKAVRGKNEFFL